jgi:hypothetical protein
MEQIGQQVTDLKYCKVKLLLDQQVIQTAAG